MLGERAGASRPREHARQIEHADAGERARARRQWLGRAVADLDDLQERKPGDDDALRMRGPFLLRAHHAARAASLDDRCLECERVPASDRIPHRRTVLRYTEHAERGRAMMREVGVNVAPAAVLGRIHAHHCITLGIGLDAVDG